MTTAAGQNFEQTYTMYAHIHLYCLIAFVVFLVLSIVLFFVLRISQAFGELTGRTARKAVREMRESNSRSGELASTKKQTGIKSRISPGNKRNRRLQRKGRTKKVKKENMKRILAFFLVISFIFSTCLTVSPYSVMAVENPEYLDGEVQKETDESQAKDSVGLTSDASESFKPDKENGSLDLETEYTEEDPLILIYGTEPTVIAYDLNSGSNLLLDTEFLTNVAVTVSTGNEDKVSIASDMTNKTLTFSPTKASDNAFSVELSMQTESFQFSKTIYVKVVPYPLTLDADSVKVSAPGKAAFSDTKIYDATSLVDVRAALKVNGDLQTTTAAQTEIKGFASVVFTNYDSGIINVRDQAPNQIFTFKPSDLSAADISDDLKNNYTIKSQEEARATVTIVRRVLKLTVADTSREFRSLKYDNALQSLVSINTPEEDTGFAGTDSDALKGFVYPTVVDTTAAGMTNGTIKKEDTASFGHHTDVLILDFTGSDASDNYIFDSNDYEKGTLTITEETDTSGYVSVNNAASTHVFEREDKKARFYGKDAVVKFTLDGAYTRIYLADGTDITENGTFLEAGFNSGETKKITVYLTREERTTVDGVTATALKAKTEPFDITFTYDQDAPLCENIDFGVSNKVISDMAASLTFGIYDKKQIEAFVSFSDTYAGVKGWSYYVANTAVDTKIKDLLSTAEEDNDYGEVLINSRFVAGTEDGKIKVGTLTAGQTIEGGNNYIVFVKVIDNVGNVKIYGSDGIVLENFQDISVRFEEKSQNNHAFTGSWDGISFYSGDAALALKAEENASESKYYSGLDWMKYVVSRHYGDGSTKTEEEQTVDKEKPENVTLKQLLMYCTIEKTLSFVDEKARSQVITVSATATDNAGNTMETAATHTIVLDSVAPEFVTSTFLQENNGGEFFNGHYAKSNVTYAAAIKERFLKDLFVYINGESYTLAELQAQKGALGIASVTMDETADITKTTDESVYRFSVEFASDGDYDVYTTAGDAAGNRTSDDGFTFTIDTVLPELEVTYTAYHKDGTTSILDPSKGRAYADETVSHVTARAVITEMNFDGKDARVEYIAVNSNDETVEVPNFDEAFRKEWNNKGYVSESDKRSVMVLTLPTINIDANYEFIYNYTDLAGNTLAEELIQTITVDRTKPEGTIVVDDLVNGSASGIWAKLLNVITFGYFGKNSIKVSMTGEDETAGVASVRYLASDTALSRTVLEKRTDWTEYKNTLTCKASQHLVVYEKITDKAGNIQYISTDGIIVDNVDPVPVVKITPASLDWGKGVYNAGNNPGFNITVTDPIFNDSYAGLKKITYKIVNGTNGAAENGTLAELTKASHKQQWTGHMTIDPDKFYSNDVQVTVYAEDWSANRATSEKISIKVDNKAPVVKFTFDKGDVHNSKYYRNDKKLIITVEERNFDASYMPKISSSAGGGYKIGHWNHNGEIHTLVITFTGDSDYTVTYDCCDLAGNKSNTEKLNEFTVDKTLPVIKVAYDNNNALNDSYYKAAITATITVTEHNFDPGQINVNTTASVGGEPKVSGWISHGETHTAKVSFAHDADYTFSVGGLDLAGNKAEDYSPDKFTVDLTAPEITITGVEDKSANNGTVAPVINIKDINFIPGGAEVTLTGVNTGEKNVKSLASISSTATGMTVKFHNFASGMDDIYTLCCKSVDKAGNETVVSIRFSVNRDGSTYEIDEETQKLLDKGYTNKPQDIVIAEINTDTLKLIEISYSLDGKVITLKQGTDYTIEARGGEDHWKKYIYKINAACFETEGTYVVNIYSEDAANNTTTNKAKAKTVVFTVDKTAPIMVVANLSNGGRYKEESHLFTLNARDNILLDYVELYLDGVLVHTYEDEELTAANGELLIEIGSSNQYQIIELISCDKAGNISREVYDAESDAPIAAAYKVLVTADGFVQYINNIPLLVGSILLALFVTFLIIVLIKIYRKDGG